MELLTANLTAAFDDKSIEKMKTVAEVIDSALTPTETIEKDTPFISCSLAASYGELTSEALKIMDKNLLVMIGATMKSLDKLTGEKDWDSIKSCMMQNPCLEPMENSEISRSDSLHKKSSGFLKVDGSPDGAITKEVEQWIKKLIADDDVIEDLKFDPKIYARIVAESGATVKNFQTVFYASEHHSRSVVDIGVIRYPDIDHPYFKVYRLKLVAWAKSVRVGPVEKNDNGITGDFNSRKFQPRESVLAGMTEEVRGKAIDIANSLFD